MKPKKYELSVSLGASTKEELLISLKELVAEIEEEIKLELTRLTLEKESVNELVNDISGLNWTLEVTE